MKKWEKNLADIRLLAPDIPEIQKAVKELYDYIEILEEIIEQEEKLWPDDFKFGTNVRPKKFGRK